MIKDCQSSFSEQLFSDQLDQHKSRSSPGKNQQILIQLILMPCDPWIFCLADLCVMFVTCVTIAARFAHCCHSVNVTHSVSWMIWNLTWPFDEYWFWYKEHTVNCHADCCRGNVDCQTRSQPGEVPGAWNLPIQVNPSIANSHLRNLTLIVDHPGNWQPPVQIAKLWRYVHTAQHSYLVK